MSIVHSLQRNQIPKEYLRPFDLPFIPVRIVHIEFDFLNQRFTTAEDYSSPKIIRNAYKRGADIIAQELRDAGAGQVGWIPPAGRCDACHLMSMSYKDVGTADFGSQFNSTCAPSSDGTEACAACKLTGRPCTFTNHKLLSKNRVLQLALWPRKLGGYPVLSTRDPKIIGPGAVLEGTGEDVAGDDEADDEGDDEGDGEVIDG